MLLQPLEGETPSGRPIDMHTETEFFVAEPDAAMFEVVCAYPEQDIVAAAPSGWTLLGTRVMAQQSVADLFGERDPRLSREVLAFSWTGTAYAQLPSDMPLNAERGYWVRLSGAGRTGELHGPLADGLLALRPGWNLISPVGVCDASACAAVRQPIWEWDRVRQVYRITEGALQPGNAYWVYVTGEAVCYLSSN